MNVKLISTGAAAKLMGVSPDTVRKMCDENRIRAQRIGRLYRIVIDEDTGMLMDPVPEPEAPPEPPAPPSPEETEDAKVTKSANIQRARLKAERELADEKRLRDLPPVMEQREIAVEAREHEVIDADVKLTAREAAVKNREDAVTEGEKAVKLREIVAKSAIAEAPKRQVKQDADWIEIKERQWGCNAWEADLDERDEKVHKAEHDIEWAESLSDTIARSRTIEYEKTRKALEVNAAKRERDWKADRDAILERDADAADMIEWQGRHRLWAWVWRMLRKVKR